MRQDMTRAQITQAVEGNFLSCRATYAQAIFQYINEKRAADYVVLSPDTGRRCARAQRSRVDWPM